MEPEIRDLIKRAIKVFAQTTGMKAAHHAVAINGKKIILDGLVRIEHQDLHWDFAVQVKRKLTRAMVATEKAQATMLRARSYSGHRVCNTANGRLDEDNRPVFYGYGRQCISQQAASLCFHQRQQGP